MKNNDSCYYAYMVKTILEILEEQDEEEIIKKIYKKAVKILKKKIFCSFTPTRICDIEAINNEEE